MVKEVDLNGLTLQYREIGDALAPPLIALHALGQSAESWDEVAVKLSRDFRFLAFDQRGMAEVRDQECIPLKR